MPFIKKERRKSQGREADGLRQEAEARKRQAETEAKRAEAAAKQAGAARDEALMTQSKFLADLSRQVTEQGDGGTGLLLALEASRDEVSEDEVANRDLHIPQRRSAWKPPYGCCESRPCSMGTTVRS